MPTTPSFVSIGKPARTVRFFLRTVSSVSSIAVWKPITGSVTATDANVLQGPARCRSLLFRQCATLASRKRNFSLYRYKVIELLMVLTVTLPCARVRKVYIGGGRVSHPALKFRIILVYLPGNTFLCMERMKSQQ